jgi:hypothetical protein
MALCFFGCIVCPKRCMHHFERVRVCTSKHTSSPTHSVLPSYRCFSLRHLRHDILRRGTISHQRGASGCVRCARRTYLLLVARRRLCSENGVVPRQTTRHPTICVWPVVGSAVFLVLYHTPPLARRSCSTRFHDFFGALYTNFIALAWLC